MLSVLIIGAAVTFVTQLAKRYVTWAKANPKAVVLLLTAVGTTLAFRYVGVNWFWTFGLSALVAVGLYEWLVKPALTQ